MAKADTTILERDRSDRQAPVKRLVPNEELRPAQSENLPAPDIAPFSPFVLRHVQVEGSSLSNMVIDQVTSPFIGATVDRPAVDALAKEMSETYRKSDVALYSILVPNQSGDGGTLRIVIIESRIDEVLVSGDTSHSNLVHAQEILAPIINETPLRRSTLERSLALLGAVPGTKFEPQFLKTNLPGVVKLSVVLKTRDFDAGIGIGTRGSAELGSTQLQADVSLNAMLRPGDHTTFSFGTPVDFKHFRYYGVAHQTPITTDGVSLAANAGYLVTQPSGVSIRGKAALGGLQLSYPVILSFTRVLSLSLGFDGLNSDNAFLGEGISSDRTRAIRASGSYLEMFEDQQRLTAMLSLSQGINAAGARTTNPILSDLAFLKLSGQLDYDLPIGESLVLRLSSAAQYSRDKLPSAEQSSLGGEAFGRAFDSAIVSGDRSAAASAELAYPLRELFVPLSSTEFYTFVDGGQIWRTGRGGVEGSSTGLASAGLGARVTVFSNVALGLELARPLDAPDTDPGNKDWRAIFSFSTRTN